MKKVILVLFIICFSQLSFSQMTSGTDCSCQPGYTKCFSVGAFMSCCTCCQAGSTCGAWSAFGLAGCACEDTKTTKSCNDNNYDSHAYSSSVAFRFYPENFHNLIDLLNAKGIQTQGMESAFAELKIGSSTKIDEVNGEFFTVDVKKLNVFLDKYLCEATTIQNKNTSFNGLINTFVKNNPLK